MSTWWRRSRPSPYRRCRVSLRAPPPAAPWLRRVAVHGRAVAAWAAGPGAAPLAVPRHARLGGDMPVAAAALTTAAAQAADRFEPGAAEALLDEAIGLTDAAAARLARG